MSGTLKVILWIIIVVVLLFVGLILAATLSDFKPEASSRIEMSASPEVLLPGAELDILIWNIGYAGLDASMDFFYDGGKQVRPSEENVIGNLNAIENFLGQNDTVEFVLLQEVDVESKRSYRLNQADTISKELSDYYNYIALNYKVLFVPLPVHSPMGRVTGGLMSLTKYQPELVRRHSFPGNFAWPKNLFMLDRCFLVSRHPVAGGKELLVVNTHNSAYDDGSLRKKQMEYLRVFLKEEYQKGNYIIVGGDWNQSPPGFVKSFDDQEFDSINYNEISEDYLPENWQWAYDETLPTNRRVGTVYERSITPTTLIDFFLVSPNIYVETVKGVDLDFQHSDHQPVLLKVKLDEAS
jgi:endonuclease/exonuclease/phosphatase family metal-dependent hydrolase